MGISGCWWGQPIKKGYQMYIKDMYLRHIRSGNVGRVVSVDNKFGILFVKYAAPLSVTKTYSLLDESMLTKTFHVMTDIEIADFRLAQEKHGLTDSWAE